MLRAGDPLDKYRLERLLRGGMGEVWAARDPDLDRRWDLASYDADELGEIELSWSDHRSVATLGDAFRTRVLPALEDAVRRHDAEKAFADTARACNECQLAAGMKFLEISTQLGAAVPVIDR